MKPLYYDRKGQPMEMEEWGRALNDFEGRRIAETTLPDGTWISTVWLGLDHGLGWGGGAPLIFETMVFSPKGRADHDCARYSTEEEAKAGHEAMVAEWSQKQ